MGTLRRREALWAYALLFPTIVLFLVFMAGPLVASFLISLMHWSLLSPPRWAGLGQYQHLLHDSAFWTAVGNTAYFTAGTVLPRLVLALLLALALNRKMRARNLYRTIYFLPVVSMLVAVALVWSWLYSPQDGLINYALALVHLPQPAWLSSTRWAMPAIIIMSIWKTVGYDMILYLAGLQSIPEHLYEAARIDGANRWNLFQHITFPLLTPTTFFVLVVSVIGSFQVFDQAYIMTQGGPGYATTTLVYYIYNNAFQWFHMGYASAQAWVLLVLVLGMTLLQLWGQRRWVFYQ